MARRFYTTEQLGPRRARTPDGFLICYDVPLARTGIMIYGPNETPVTPGPDGITRIIRDEAEVFRPETIASGNGKPVVDSHPEGADEDEWDVTPENYRQIACGHAINPHRGSGDTKDLMLGDLMITCPELIRDIDNGKREVSLGYDAEYEEIEPGLGRQRNIVINHIALVSKGRCGPRCAIGDQRTTEVDLKTTDKAKPSILDRIKSAFKAKDEAALDAVLEEAKEHMKDADPDEGGEGGVHHHVHIEQPERDTHDDEERFGGLEQRVADLEQMVARLLEAEEGEGHEELDETHDDEEEEEIEEQLEQEAPAGKGADARKAKDSALLADSFQNTVAIAEILAPGTAVPEFKKKEAPKKTLDSINTLRRDVLTQAYAIPETKEIIEEVLGGVKFDVKKMTHDGVRTLFIGAAALKRRSNNKTGSDKTTDTRTTEKKGITSVADLNARHREVYKPGR